ncbi:MAG: hypothetical protein RLZZ505_3310 [Verrucomicrobiota bacterium]|jgi:hypothetical protein
MPLTDFQREVLAVIVANRSEESHFAGGLVLNVTPESPRFSKDFDFFHDAVEALAAASERDTALLRAAGYEVIPDVSYGKWDTMSSFRRADVQRGADTVTLDWAHDTAWRFFPIVHDPVLGWRLHLFDMAVNKALALSGRTETRDYVDILELGRLFSLEAIVWAACGKDEGFSPLFLLKMMRRFAKTERGELDKIKARHLDPIEMKMEWIEMCEKAEAEITHLADTQPDIPIGVVFVDAKGEPGWIGKDPMLRIHRLSLRGSWPETMGE